MGTRAKCLGLLLAVIAATALPAGAQSPEGKEVYDRWCAGCHGVDGRGAGPGAAAMLPPPRDFADALYQVRETGSGELPTDQDILDMINVGMPGSAMPGWENVLTAEERESLVEYLKSFSRFFESFGAPEPIDFGSQPSASDERIEEGRQLFQEVECSKCHGQEGRGDGTSASTLEDDYGFPIWPADLTENWRFNGGGTVADIYRRFMTGMDGTPMPSVSDLLDAEIVTEDQLWSLAYYVRSLSPDETPEIREVIRASLISEGSAPSTIDDPQWGDAEPYYVPLVGQIILKPRWFNPRVDGIWVQALHDGADLALLVSWSDPSQSPDPEWADFTRLTIQAMETGDEGSATDWGAPDQLTVQFPQTLPRGLERPYFLQGDARRPAYLWTWRSDSGAGVESVARGMGTAAPPPAESQALTVAPSHEDGEWKVLFRRSLTTDDVDGDIQFPLSHPMPIAFQAWDGDNGERGNQAAVSTWVFISLEEATSMGVFAIPGLAGLLTIVLGVKLVSQARKREMENFADESDPPSSKITDA